MKKQDLSETITNLKQTNLTLFQINSLSSKDEDTLPLQSLLLSCIGNISGKKYMLTRKHKTKIAEFANSVDLNKVAHNEPPHQDLHCLPSNL